VLLRAAFLTRPQAERERKREKEREREREWGWVNVLQDLERAKLVINLQRIDGGEYWCARERGIINVYIHAIEGKGGCYWLRVGWQINERFVWTAWHKVFTPPPPPLPPQFCVLRFFIYFYNSTDSAISLSHILTSDEPYTSHSLPPQSSCSCLFGAPPFAIWHHSLIDTRMTCQTPKAVYIKCLIICVLLAHIFRTRWVPPKTWSPFTWLASPAHCIPSCVILEILVRVLTIIFFIAFLRSNMYNSRFFIDSALFSWLF
jgi:hypothetical protein